MREASLRAYRPSNAADKQAPPANLVALETGHSAHDNNRQMQFATQSSGRCSVLFIASKKSKDAKEGWSRVTPFVQAQKLNYPILMGDDQVTKTYKIKALPATYLIDMKGRIAATHVGVLADKNNVEANIKILLNEQ